jgi:diguanylate cyclase (GGDEF)-like protein
MKGKNRELVDKLKEKYRTGDMEGVQKMISNNHLLEMVPELLVSLVSTEDELKRAQGALENAHIDGLTGLPDRKRFERVVRNHLMHEELGHLGKGVGERKPVSLALVDIDHFKRINDRYGEHEAGDIALAAVGRIVREEVRKSDLAFRYGGEEFAVLMPDTTAERAYQVGEHLRKAMEAHDFSDCNVVGEKITVSIGIDEYPYVLGEVKQMYRQEKDQDERRNKYFNWRRRNKFPEIKEILFRNGPQWVERIRGHPEFREFYIDFLAVKMFGRADRALYHSKHAGRNKVTVYREMPEPEPAKAGK